MKALLANLDFNMINPTWGSTKLEQSKEIKVYNVAQKYILGEVLLHKHKCFNFFYDKQKIYPVLAFNATWS